MIYEIAVSQQAEADLRDIYEYISFALLAPRTAASQIDRIEKAIAGLRRMPLRFKAYDKEPWRGRGLRVLPVDNFIVSYIPDEGSGTVTIIRVMYGGRDIETELSEHAAK